MVLEKYCAHRNNRFVCTAYISLRKYALDLSVFRNLLFSASERPRTGTDILHSGLYGAVMHTYSRFTALCKTLVRKAKITPEYHINGTICVWSIANKSVFAIKNNFLLQNLQFL